MRRRGIYVACMRSHFAAKLTQRSGGRVLERPLLFQAVIFILQFSMIHLQGPSKSEITNNARLRMQASAVSLR